MKRILFSIIILMLVGHLSAQQLLPSGNRNDFMPYHDFRIGIGLKPFEAAYAWENLFNWGMDSWLIDPKLVNFNSKDYYSGARYTTNALFFDYTYHANKWLGVGGTLTYFSYFNNYYDVLTDASVGHNTIHHISIYPTVRFSWLNRKSFSLYSSFGIGSRLVLQNDVLRSDVNNSGRIGIACQITLVGFTIGKRYYGFSDLSTLGTQGIITAGIGYRLTANKKIRHEKQADFTR